MYPVVEELIKVILRFWLVWKGWGLTCLQKNLGEPYDWDEYAQTFFPKAEELVAKAEAAEKEGNQEKASEFYM